MMCKLTGCHGHCGIGTLQEHYPSELRLMNI